MSLTLLFGGSEAPPAIDGTVAMSQAASAMAGVAAETFAATTVMSQAVPGMSAAALETFAATLATAQAQASLAGVGTLAFDGTVTTTQIPSAMSASGALLFTGTTTTAQTQSMSVAGGQDIVGTIATQQCVTSLKVYIWQPHLGGYGITNYRGNAWAGHPKADFPYGGELR